MRIDGFETAIDIYDISINMKLGEHSTCTFKADIKDEDIIKYTDMAKKRYKTSISAVKSGIEIMRGFVNKVTVKHNVSGTSVFISIISDSAVCSEKSHKNIFQNTSKKYKDIIGHYKDYNISFQNADSADETTEKIIVQDEISDFDFIKYTASLCGCGVWVENDTFIIGKSLNNKCLQSVKSDIFSEKVLRFESEFTENNTFVNFETMNYIKNGSVVSFKNTGGMDYIASKDFIIYEVSAFKQDDDIFYSYKAAEKLSYESDYSPFCTVSRARVVKNDDSENFGRICVNFLDYEDVEFDENSSVWINYTSPYTGNRNAGVVMVPDADDIVHVNVYSDYTVSYGSLREKAIHEKCSDINMKSVMIGEKKLVQFKEDEIVIENSEENRTVIKEENTDIKIKDKTDILIEDKIITVSIGDNLTLKADDKKAQVNIEEKTSAVIENNKLSVKTGDKTCLVLDDKKITAVQNESGIIIEKEGITAEKKNKSQIKLNDKTEIKSEGEITVFSKKLSEIKTSSGSVCADGSKISLKGTDIKMST